ncbi:MAG: hypothetical protein DRN54_02890 [Thaumarchaeota archaeon]|nr:MAG: hypothetical protein DRN54_02890 [Nitrososphaerota archaeon]
MKEVMTLRIRVSSTVSAYPFYNYRYVRLLRELASRFRIRIFAASKLPSNFLRAHENFQVIYVFPFVLPRNIRYRIGPYISQIYSMAYQSDIILLFEKVTEPLLLFSRTPIILDMDDPDFKKLARSGAYKVLNSDKIRKIVIPSELAKKRLISLGVAREKLEVIPNGVDLKLFRPQPLPSEEIVLYYGTLTPNRAKLLLESIRIVCRARPTSNFLVIGEVPRPFIETLKSLRLLNRVKLTGFVPHDSLPSYLARARVCIFPQENSLGGRLPMKLLDYMASGRPIVATDVDESWPVKEAGSGIITPPDPSTFAEAILKLLEDEQLSLKLVQNGIKYVRNFSWEKIAAKYAKLIEEVFYG